MRESEFTRIVKAPEGCSLVCSPSERAICLTEAGLSAAQNVLESKGVEATHGDSILECDGPRSENGEMVCGMAGSVLLMHADGYIEVELSWGDNSEEGA